MTDFIVIIPARFASTRFPGKPLVPLTGAGGRKKSLIQRSWECASSIPGCRGIWVATDDERIADEVERFGGKVVMTNPDCANGTERCAEAAVRLDVDVDVIVNLQGDAPLTPAHLVPALVERLRADPDAAMATPAVRCAPSTYAHLASDVAAGRVGGTTVVMDARSRALYFSKRLLPYIDPARGMEMASACYLHLGVYAYRRPALEAYASQGPSQVEQLEGLEQLRFLHLGMPVSVVAGEPFGWDPIELNNPSDVPVIERFLQERGVG
jgi:3-deoxy-manno-octulosonate cytidylyltransferase (CMP-KDO synthetase)